jgi:dihydropteroate synthase
VRLRHATGVLDTSRCLVMGILNRTPDSFFDGGRMDLDASVAHGAAMVAAGADLIDLGAVKAGPGDEVSEDEEIGRLLPLVEALARSGAVISVETGRPSVAAAALAAGASLINDVSALADPGLAPACAAAGAGLVLMHNGGQLRGRPRNPRYDDVVADVAKCWERLAERALEAGVSPDSIVVDPGLDFGKTVWHSLALVRRLDELVAGGRPVLLAPSHKDVVGESLALGLGDRLEGTLALVALSVLKGAAIVRVHEVAPTARTVAMVEAVMGRREPLAAVRGLWE